MIYEGLSVPKAYYPINPTLNTVGVPCGGIMPIPCVSKIRYNITINKVACFRHAELSYLFHPTRHFASCGVNKIMCFQHLYGSSAKWIGGVV